MAHFLLENFVCGFDLDTSALVIYSSGMTKSFHEKFNRKITNSNTRGVVWENAICYLHRVFPEFSKQSNGSGTCVNAALQWQNSKIFASLPCIYANTCFSRENSCCTKFHMFWGIKIIFFMFFMRKLLLYCYGF